MHFHLEQEPDYGEGAPLPAEEGFLEGGVLGRVVDEVHLAVERPPAHRVLRAATLAGRRGAAVPVEVELVEQVPRVAERAPGDVGPVRRVRDLLGHLLEVYLNCGGKRNCLWLTLRSVK